jgi:hypothetical protein
VDTDDAGSDPSSPIDDTLNTAAGDAVLSLMHYAETTDRMSISGGTSIADTVDGGNWGLGICAGYRLSEGATQTIQYTKSDVVGRVIISGFSIPKA